MDFFCADIYGGRFHLFVDLKKNCKCLLLWLLCLNYLRIVLKCPVLEIIFLLTSISCLKIWPTYHYLTFWLGVFIPIMVEILTLKLQIVFILRIFCYLVNFAFCSCFSLCNDVLNYIQVSCGGRVSLFLDSMICYQSPCRKACDSPVSPGCQSWADVLSANEFLGLTNSLVLTFQHLLLIGCFLSSITSSASWSL